MRTIFLRTQVKCVNTTLNNIESQLPHIKPCVGYLSLFKNNLPFVNFCTSKYMSTYNENEISREQPIVHSNEQHKKVFKLPFFTEKQTNDSRHRDRELHFVTQAGSSNIKFKTARFHLTWKTPADQSPVLLFRIGISECFIACREEILKIKIGFTDIILKNCKFCYVHIHSFRTLKRVTKLSLNKHISFHE